MRGENLPWQVEGPMLVCEVCHGGQPPGIRREGEGASCIHCGGKVVRVVALSEVREALLGEEAVEAAMEALPVEGITPVDMGASNAEVHEAVEKDRAFAHTVLVAALNAAFPSDSEEGRR